MSKERAGATVAAQPRPEYPRPDFQRSDWLNLNGPWDFAFDDEEKGLAERWYEQSAGPVPFDKTIIVPFCHQSAASGLGDEGLHEVVWYRRAFTAPAAFSGRRTLLHFGAVDYSATVWINGRAAGSHRGGNISFRMDITDFLKPGENSIVLRAEDRYDCNQPRGKQIWKGHVENCWYVATTGIWQSVWIEAAGPVYIDRIGMRGDIGRRALDLEVYLGGILPGSMAALGRTCELEVLVSFGGKELKRRRFTLDERVSHISIDMKHGMFYDSIQTWSPEAPNLYDLEFKLFSGGAESDVVTSYFGFRELSVREGRIYLNGSPLYQKLVLDQGYWPDTLLTPPSDEAIVRDIELARSFGFNGARKHQKVEDPRFYYHADRMGFLVWGELPSAYDYSTETAANLMDEMKDFIARDGNHPSIVAWVPLNESWGVRSISKDPSQQNLSLALYHYAKALDPSRLVSSNDGWEQTETDICGIHDYEAQGESFLRKIADRDAMLKGACANRLVYADGFAWRGEPILVTEYGGIAFEDPRKAHWGYAGAVRDEAAFMERFAGMTRAIRSTAWISGYCYTQLTDVFQEVNGLADMDRKPKVTPAMIKRVLDE